MFKTLLADFRIIFDRDPAARNWLEVLICYPGFQALVFHRIAHSLYSYKLPFLPRLISHICKRQLLFALLQLLTFVCPSAIENILFTTLIVNFC
ncbi:MAG: hypothetical protein O4808_01685, partial [Trichodesmium sp. St17_bin3_1_1]|nr:hypothetical protein [Trichodesmium sp. St17_bin3_1_1]